MEEIRLDAFCESVRDGTHDTPKPVKEKQRKKQKTQSTKEGASKSDSSVLYDSVEQAMNELNLTGKPKGTILSSLVGKRDFVYNYNWDLVKITL